MLPFKVNQMSTFKSDVSAYYDEVLLAWQSKWLALLTALQWKLTFLFTGFESVRHQEVSVTAQAEGGMCQGCCCSLIQRYKALRLQISLDVSQSWNPSRIRTLRGPTWKNRPLPVAVIDIVLEERVDLRQCWDSSEGCETPERNRSADLCHVLNNACMRPSSIIYTQHGGTDIVSLRCRCKSRCSTQRSTEGRNTCCSGIRPHCTV